MDNKSNVQLLIMKSIIEANRQDSDVKIKNLTEYLKVMITSTIISMIDHINISKSLSDQKDSSKDQYPTTIVPVNRVDPPLGDGHSTKIGGMWTLKHDISLSKFYELLIKIELKVNTALDLNNFYNHINMCLNAVTRII